MRLKYLSCCLLSLSIVGCSQHVIKSNSNTSNSTNTSLEQQAVTGVNAMYEYPSYDYRGNMGFQFDTSKGKVANTQTTSNSTQNLDPAIQKQLDQYLKQQKLSLSKQEKQALYEAILAEQSPYSYGQGSDSSSARIAAGLMNFMNDLKISYDGSVHYRDKMASLNLVAKYQKPTLLVEAKLPMVVDFQNYKFYANYFAFMPYLVNKDSQASYAYLDFSKYKQDLDRVNVPKLVDYLKQMNALPYVLADTKQLQRMHVSASEKQQGISNKIRYQGDLGNLMLQMSLFEQINKPYLTQRVMGVVETDTVSEDASIVAEEAEKAADAAVAASSESVSAQAYASSERVATLINNRLDELLYPEQESTDASEHTEEVAEAQEETVEDEVAEDVATGAVAAASSSQLLSEQACEALLSSKKHLAIGDVTYCQDIYGIKLLQTAQGKAKSTASASALEQKVLAMQEVEHIFEPYVSDQLTDVQAFKALWIKHQPEIQAALAESGQAMPVTIDVALDNQGRAVDLAYQLQFADETIGNFGINLDMQVSNYGHATPIDKKALRDAKSVEEVTKGSMLENVVTGFTKSLGMSGTGVDGQQGEQLSFDQQLSDLAEKTFANTGSYIKTYQSVFVLMLSANRPEIVKHYSNSELNEIAEVYAYRFNDRLEEPKGKALTRLNSLKAKHKLLDPDQFDELGYSAARIVQDASEGAKEYQAWNKRVQQYKTPQAVFADYYIELFQDDYELNAEQTKTLKSAAAVLGQAFADDRKDKLSEQSIAKLNKDHDGFMDYDLYEKAYVAVVKHLK
ncbi:hypothetical protein F4W09_06545 [Acinetobacter tandoii]|uniref:Lipoprotein n=1 Tax=Acinetobacter tandoii TaxID=202954 RepID=A0A5N4WJK1_9GAMM|nr:hypothetical protein [Acinetobacter tandoii]KAB1856642.1 hypothetical protein F4W09_06545 [Acinetobacter tandoii]